MKKDIGRKRNIGIATLALCALSMPALAQDDMDLFDMDPEALYDVEVVSGTRSKRSIKELPMNVYVITAEDIRRNNYTSLVQALEDVPNIKTSRPGNGSEGETFLQRGLFGNYYTKFLLDDVPINPIINSGFPIGEQINMRNIDRIEIVFGPSSAIYGADAVAGVINIISKRPEGNEAQVTYKGGADYNYGNAYGSYVVSEAETPVHLDVYGLYSNRGDWDITDGYEGILDPNNYPLAEVLTDPFDPVDIEARAWSAGAKLRAGGLTVSYDIMYRRDNSSIGQYTSWYFYDDPDAIWGETIQRGLIKYDGSSGDFDFSTRLSYLRDRLDNDSYFSFIFPTVDPTTFGQRNRAYKYQASDEITFEQIVTWNASEDLEVTSGFQYNYIGQLPKTNDLPAPFDESDYDAFSSDPLPPSPIFGQFGNNPKTVRTWGAFVQALYTLDKLTTLGSIRYDHNSRFGSTVNPRIGGRYNFTESTSITANYGQAYKAPSPYFEFNAVAGLNGDGTINYLGVPAEGALDPEEFESFEVGFRHLWSSKISTEITAFYNELDNLIKEAQTALDNPVLYPNAGGDTASVFNNDGNSNIQYYGADFILRARNLIPSINFGGDLFVTYTKGEQNFPVGNGSINEILMQPEWSTKLRLSATPIQNLTVGVDNKWFSDWYYRGISSEGQFNDGSPSNKISGDYVMDFYSTYNATENLTFYFEIENVFDRQYSGIEAYQGISLPGNPQQNRNFFGGLQLRF